MKNYMRIFYKDIDLDNISATGWKRKYSFIDMMLIFCNMDNSKPLNYKCSINEYGSFEYVYEAIFTNNKKKAIQNLTIS